MKFSESLSQGLVPEWKDQYLEYKKGKKIIKKIQLSLDEQQNDRTPLLKPQSQTNANYGDALSPEDENDQNKHSNISFKTSIFSKGNGPNTVESGKKEYKNWLDSQHYKVNEFFKEKEQEVYERFLVLEDQLYQLKEQRNWILRRQKTQLRSIQLDNDDSAPMYKRVNVLALQTKNAIFSLNRFDLPSLPSNKFLNKFKSKLASHDISMTDPTPDEFDVNYFENRVRNGITDDRIDNASIDSDSSISPSNLMDHSNLTIMPQTQQQQSIDMIKKKKKRDYETKKQNFGVPFLLARKQLKEAVLEHYRSLILLRSYKELNRTAFRKITKKYDKITHSTISVDYMKKIDTDSYFLTSDILNKLIFQVEELFISFFDPELTDRKHSLEKLKSIAYALNNNQLKMSSYYLESFGSGIFLGLAIPLFALALYGGLHNYLGGNFPEGIYLLQIYGGFFLLNLLFVLFALNMAVFDAFKINYKFIFEFNIATALDYRQFLLIPSIMFGFLSFVMYFSLNDYWPDKFPAREWPWLFFGIPLILFFWPFDHFYFSARKWLQAALIRIILSGFYPVEFRDFFLGDLLCSLTYTMGNISFFFCLYSHHWNGLFSDNGPSRANNVCGSSKSRLMGFFAALPSIWRFLQCVRRYADSGDWFPHLANMAKYGVGAIYYAMLSAYRINKSSKNRIVFIVFACINSLYTATWDIVMDWSLLQFGSKNWLLRDNLFYKRPVYYYVAMVTDVILRFQWIFYAFFSNQIQQLAVTSFCIAVAELIRRVIWVFFRMENEHVTNVILFRASRDSPLPYAISGKVERAIKKLVSLRYADKPSIFDTSRDDTSAISSAIRAPTMSSIDSEAQIETTPTRAEMPRITRRRGTLANFSDALNKAHIKDFQRRKKIRIDDDTDDDDDDDDDDAKTIPDPPN